MLLWYIKPPAGNDPYHRFLYIGSRWCMDPLDIGGSMKIVPPQKSVPNGSMHHRELLKWHRISHPSQPWAFEWYYAYPSWRKGIYAKIDQVKLQGSSLTQNDLNQDKPQHKMQTPRIEIVARTKASFRRWTVKQKTDVMPAYQTRVTQQTSDIALITCHFRAQIESRLAEVSIH